MTRRVFNDGLSLDHLPSIIPLNALCQNITVIILVWSYRSNCLSSSRSSSEVVDHVRLAFNGVLHVDDDLCDRGDEKKENYNLLKRYTIDFLLFLFYYILFSFYLYFFLTFLSLFLPCLLHSLEVL